MKASRKTTLTALIVTVFLILIPVAGCLAIKAKAGAAMEQHEAYARKRIAEIRAADPGRPALAPAIDRNAWDEYRPALDAIDLLVQADHELFEARRYAGGGAFDLVKYGPWMEKYAEPLAALRKGLSCTKVDPGHAYESGYAMMMPYSSKALGAIKALSAFSEVRHGQGRDREALEAAITCIGMGNDLVRKSLLVDHLISSSTRSYATADMKRILSSNTLSMEDLAAITSEFDVLESGHPEFIEGLELDDLVFARLSAIKIANGEVDLGSLGGGPRGPTRHGDFIWAPRYACSRKVMMADAMAQQEVYIQRMRQISKLPTWERFQAAERMEAGQEFSNPLMATVSPPMANSWKIHAADRMNMALARIAIGLAWFREEHGAYPDALSKLVPRHCKEIPPDPFTGQAFRLIIKEDAAVLYGVGSDGVDDGGKPCPDDDPYKPGDVAWTIHRK